MKRWWVWYHERCVTDVAGNDWTEAMTSARVWALNVGIDWTEIQVEEIK